MSYQSHVPPSPPGKAKGIFAVQQDTKLVSELQLRSRLTGLIFSSALALPVPVSPWELIPSNPRGRREDYGTFWRVPGAHAALWRMLFPDKPAPGHPVGFGSAGTETNRLRSRQTLLRGVSTTLPRPQGFPDTRVLTRGKIQP